MPAAYKQKASLSGDFLFAIQVSLYYNLKNSFFISPKVCLIFDFYIFSIFRHFKINIAGCFSSAGKCDNALKGVV